MKGLRLVILLLLPIVPAALATEKTKAPTLEILSRFGRNASAKLYNNEPVMFFARPAGVAGNAPLRSVKFLFYDEGGDPARSECIRKTTEDKKRWGRPPPSFTYPIRGLTIPVGRYRLRAVRKGFKHAEIKITVARFGTFDVDSDRDKDSYKASFRLQLVDVTRTRKPVSVEVRVESRTGGLVDKRKIVLGAIPHRAGQFETPGRIRLDSRRKKPNMKSPAGAQTGVLKVVPGSRLVLVLDRLRFIPIPLPPGAKRSSKLRGGGEGGGGRGR